MCCRCENEFEWLLNMLKKGNCFSDWKDVAEFIDGHFLDLRYMKKRFGYLFYDECKYIKKINGRDAIFVNKEDEYVCRKPEEPTFHGIDEDGKMINVTIPLEDKERYEMKYLDDLDKGDPFISHEDKWKNGLVKKTANILKKIKLVKPEIFNSDEFFEVLDSEEFDDVKLEENREKFYGQVKKVVLGERLELSETEKLKIVERLKSYRDKMIKLYTMNDTISVIPDCENYGIRILGDYLDEEVAFIRMIMDDVIEATEKDEPLGESIREKVLRRIEIGKRFL